MCSGIRVSLTVFYLVPIVMSVAWFGRRVAMGVVLGSLFLRLAGDYIAVGEQPLPLWTWWNVFSTLIVFLFMVWIFGNLLELRRRLEVRIADRTAQLLQSSEDRRLLEHQLLSAGLNERQQIGQELHDDICQHLVGTTLAAKVLRSGSRSRTVRSSARRCRSSTSSSKASRRRASSRAACCFRRSIRSSSWSGSASWSTRARAPAFPAAFATPATCSSAIRASLRRCTASLRKPAQRASPCQCDQDRDRLVRRRQGDLPDRSKTTAVACPIAQRRAAWACPS